MTDEEKFEQLLNQIERNTQRLTELENRKVEKKEPTQAEIKAREEADFIQMMKDINSKNY